MGGAVRVSVVGSFYTETMAELKRQLEDIGKAITNYRPSSASLMGSQLSLTELYKLRHSIVLSMIELNKAKTSALIS